MLEELFGSKVKVKILTEIGRRPYKEFYLNELSKTLKIGLGRTKDILDELADSKILEKWRSGNRILFKLNEKNDKLVFEIVKFANLNALMALDEEFKTAITNFSRAYEDILGENLLSIVIFGSVVRGEATKHSDIDILIIVKQKIGKKIIEEELRKKFSDILDIFAKITEEKIFTEKEFIEMYQTGDDFLINILKDGIIIFDKENFYSKFLFKGLPKITKATIENKLKFIKQWLDSASEMYKKYPEGPTSGLGIISIHLSRALLLLSDVLPRSKHKVYDQLKSIHEHEFAKVYKKTREWFDNPPIEVDKEEVWKILVFLREKYNECYRKLGES